MVKKKNEDYIDACDIEITFTDGVVSTYRISAGCGIAPYLAKTAGETGILTLLNGPVSHCIPVVQIREWKITQVEQDNGR